MASYGDPQTTTSYEEPYAGAMRRGFLESAHDLAQQPIPVPVQKVAGLDPYEMRAREMAGGLGGFTPYIQQGGQMMQGGYGAQQQGLNALPMAQQMYGQGAGLVGQGTGMYGQAAGMTGQAAQMYAPGAAQQFYNPYEQDVVQQTMRDLERSNLQQGTADRARAVSSGAFGGSRGRLMEQERERSFGRGAAEAVGGIRQAGYAGAQQAAQRAGQGLGVLGGQLGQFGQGLGQLGGQLGQFGQGLTSTGGQYGQLGGQLGQFGQGLGSIGGQYGNLGQAMGQAGTGFGQLGMTGQQGLMNQIGAFDKFGQTGRGIQNQMFGAQYDAANRMGQEPWKRMQQYQGMLGMLPSTRSTTTYGAQPGAGGFDFMRMFGMV